MVSAISVIIGGIVIMNVMLMSVTARRKREIGVRRAVGATKVDIMRQFIAESVMQCIAGGVDWNLARISGGAWHCEPIRPFPLPCKPASPCWASLLSSAVGLFFGIYPALRAANLDPIVALRSD